MSSHLPGDLASVDPAQAWEAWAPTPEQPWSYALAGHLFRRAAFGASPATLETAVREGFPATIESLVKGAPGFVERDEMLADLGEGFARDGEPTKLRGWWLFGMLNGGHPLREKITLFWHNHFATSINKVLLPVLMYRQNQLLRKHALGSFRRMLTEISRDGAMLVWLDSNQNVKAHPNENFAREVMELFTLGVGAYTEKDIQEAARAFTGWHIDPVAQNFAFNASEHDDGAKTFHGQTGKWNGDDVLRILLEQPKAAQFLVSKLYREFVSETAPPPTLLEPLAKKFRQSDYDIPDLVATILRSRLFYSEHALLKRIKSPVEFALGAAQSAWPGPLAPSEVVASLSSMGQALFAPPNVKGWPGGRAWLNSATLLARNNFAEKIALRQNADRPSDFKTRDSAIVGTTVPGWGDSPPGIPAKFDVSMHVRNKKASTPKEIVTILAWQFFAQPLNAQAAEKLEQFLADGNPQGNDLNARIREAAHAMMCMPAYQLC